MSARIHADRIPSCLTEPSRRSSPRMSRLPAPVEQEDGADSVLDGPVIADKGDVFGANAKTLRLDVHHLFLVRNMISSNILYCDRLLLHSYSEGAGLENRRHGRVGSSQRRTVTTRRTWSGS